MAENNIFSTLYKIDVSDKTDKKNGFTYLSWAIAWAEVKKIYPNATYTINPQILDDYGNTRFWHDDGKTGWVEVSVTIEGITQTEVLAIMDFKNNAIPVDKITSVDANKAKQRCLVKALAMHGLALHIFAKEDIPESVANIERLQEEIKTLVTKKCKISESAKEKVGALCKKAEKEANPLLDDEAITGNWNNIENEDILANLKAKIMAVRK